MDRPVNELCNAQVYRTVISDIQNVDASSDERFNLFN